jgi:hypothetical protein
VLVGGSLLLVAMAGLLLVPLALLVLALVDLVQRSDAEWSHAGQDRLTWVAIVLVVGLVGPVLYLALARPRLDRARLDLALLPPPPSGLTPWS